MLQAGVDPLLLNRVQAILDKNHVFALGPSHCLGLRLLVSREFNCNDEAVTQLIKSLLFHAHSWLGVSRIVLLTAQQHHHAPLTLRHRRRCYA
eukprot:1377083-Amphidinium_carterae.1